MRFNKRLYKVGDKRWIRRFAFIPTRINDNIIVWFETFYVRQIFVSYEYGGISVWFRWNILELVLKEDYEYEMNLLDR